MLLYALRRLIYLIPVAFGVSLVVFALVHLAPGDPISAIVPPDAPKEVIDKLKEYYGFDKPLPVQYLRWLGVTLTGDFGTSIGTGRPVVDEHGLAVVCRDGKLGMGTGPKQRQSNSCAHNYARARGTKRHGTSSRPDDCFLKPQIPRGRHRPGS